MKSNNPVGLEKNLQAYTHNPILLNGENNDTFPPFPLLL